MTAPPVNSDEDYYMDESFDEESMSEVEEEQVDEEQELEDQNLEVPEESDSNSESDVEGEYQRGNVSSTNTAQLQEVSITQFSLNYIQPKPTHTQPHARRQQLNGQRSGGGSGFARARVMKYPSSSDDEEQIVVTKTVAEVNHMTMTGTPEQMDEETISVRTLTPKMSSMVVNEYQFEVYNNVIDNATFYEEADNMSEEGEDEDEEEEIVDAHDDNYDNNADDLSEISYEEQEDDVKIGQFEENQDFENDDNENEDDEEDQLPNQDLVDVADTSESEMSAYPNDECNAEQETANVTDNELDSMAMTVPAALLGRKIPRFYPNLPTKSELPVKLGELPALSENIEDELPGPQLGEGDAANSVSVKFLEQKMTEMSEMIMKTFRLSGGSADNNALEQLAMATKLMNMQGKKLPQVDEESESISTIESPRTPNTVRSEKLTGSNCRCPVNTDNIESGEEPFMMDECGQGDGLMRYPSLQTQTTHISARISSVTPSSFNSENCDNFHMDLRRPRSCASSDKVNYKNMGRKSFSFTNPQVREIERQNHILLKKMMNVKPTIKAVAQQAKVHPSIQNKKLPQPAPRMTSAAVNRKKYQRQIDLDNEVLKRKLEAVGTRRPLFK